MSRKTTKIIFACVVVVALIAVGAVFYWKSNDGPVVGRINYGHEYHLAEIRPTERFAGVQMDQASYFKINEDKMTGEMYLKGLTATTAPIKFIVTSYKEGPKNTVINFEYIIPNGEKTTIQSLQATSTDEYITIKADEFHSIQDVITLNPEEIDKLEYNVTILVFSKEVAK